MVWISDARVCILMLQFSYVKNNQTWEYSLPIIPAERIKWIPTLHNITLRKKMRTHTVFHTLFTFAPHKMASALISSHSQESLHFGSLQHLLIKQTQQRGTGLMQQGISLVPLGIDILPGSDVIKAKSTAVKTAPLQPSLPQTSTETFHLLS